MKTKKVVSSLAAISFLFLMLGFYPGISAEKEKYEEKFQKTVPLTKDGKLFLSNIAGDIEVKTWDKAEVKIDALKISKASSLEKAKENVAKVKIEITEEGNTLRIETKYPKTRIRSLNVSVKYWLFIPSMASANVNSVSGDLILEKIGGAVKAETVSGDVSLKDIAGTMKAESVSGDVEVFKAEFAPKNVQTKEERLKLVFMIKSYLKNNERFLKPGIPVDVRISLDLHRE